MKKNNEKNNEKNNNKKTWLDLSKKELSNLNAKAACMYGKKSSSPTT